MTPPPALALAFDDAVPTAVVDRVEHAFSSFCATFGYQRVGCDAGADLEVVYGGPGPDDLPMASWRPDRGSHHGPLPTYYDHLGGRVDHLAEIHAWLAAVSEFDDPVRDTVGRVAYESTMPGRLGVDPTVAWASRHMFAFNEVLRAELPRLPERPCRFPSLDSGRLWIGASHDLDFIAITRLDALQRAVRNLAVAALSMRDPLLARSICGSLVRALGRRDPLVGGPDVVHEIEARHGVTSTWNVIVDRCHPRDGNYDADHLIVEMLLHRLASHGHEIGVHGSYTSAERSGALADEYDRLRRMGLEPAGGRQHWLRHDGASLYGELEKAGALYDSSSGFPDRAGFRHGMASPFVPYDLTVGRPARVIEVPLVMMDVALSAMDRAGADPRDAATGVLSEARSLGGAVSVLWHDTVFAGTQIRPGIETLYEDLIELGDHWTPCAALASEMAGRCARAGLPIR